MCRMHGAGGGAPLGNKNALRLGHYTAEAIAMRQAIRALLSDSRERLCRWPSSGDKNNRQIKPHTN